MSEWIETRIDEQPAIDALTDVEIKNRYGEIFGPVRAGMIDPCCWIGGHFHASCDIIAYRVIPA